MMNHRYGVIDLGTNTFHLLIAEQTEGNGIKELYREQRFTKLGEDGIETIGTKPFQRGLQAIIDYKKILDEYKASQLRAIGTAALRTATNGRLFINQVYQQTGIRIQLISGEEEADLIQKGVRKAIPVPEGKSLIMDIGGGSVEFIIIDPQAVVYAQSFQVGIAVLYRNFHRNDPITDTELMRLTRHLDQVLAPLKAMLQIHKTTTLIGAAGTFEVLENILVNKKIHPLHSQISSKKYDPFYKKLLKSTSQQRLKMEGIPASRVDFIVMALFLIKYVVDLAEIKNIIISAYAMKEGLLWEMMSKKK